MKVDAAGSSGPDGTSRARYRILVVDDSAINAKLLAMILGSLGHDTHFVSDSPSALEAMSTFRPNVVISDLGMREMDGYQLATRVRAEYRDTILVAHSGYSDPSHRSQATAAGFDFYLLKPTDPENLNQLLAAIASRRSSADRAAESDGSGEG